MRLSALCYLLIATIAAAQDSVRVDMPLGDDVTQEQLGQFFDKQKADGKDLRLPLLPIASLKTGHIGKFPYAFDPAKPAPFVKTTVLRVIDQKSFLLSVQTYAIERRRFRGKGSSDVFGPPYPKEDRVIVLKVRGLREKNDLAEGDQITLFGTYEVVGTDSYDARGGETRTVHVVQPRTIRIPQ